MMRTTVTLDADTEQMIRQRMNEHRTSFKQALNDLIREGRAAIDGPAEFRTTARSMGLPTVDLDKALRLSGELEDEDLLRRMETGS